LYGCIITDGILGRFIDESFSIRKSSDIGDDSVEDIYIIKMKTYNKQIRKAILYQLIAKK
jgi:hypothetical protein